MTETTDAMAMNVVAAAMSISHRTRARMRAAAGSSGCGFASICGLSKFTDCPWR